MARHNFKTNFFIKITGFVSIIAKPVFLLCTKNSDDVSLQEPSAVIVQIDGKVNTTTAEVPLIVNEINNITPLESDLTDNLAESGQLINLRDQSDFTFIEDIVLISKSQEFITM